MDKKPKLTPKQKVTMQLLKMFGPMFCGHGESDMRTFETLVKRGLVEVTTRSEYGRTYQLAQVQA